MSPCCHHVPALECSAHSASAQLRARGPPIDSQGCVEGTAAARGVQFDIYRWRERSSVARASEVPTFGAALSRCTRQVSIGCNTRERTAEPAALTLESCRHVPALAAHTSLRPVKSERPSCQLYTMSRRSFPTLLIAIVGRPGLCKPLGRHGDTMPIGALACRYLGADIRCSEATLLRQRATGSTGLLSPTFPSPPS